MNNELVLKNSEFGTKENPSKLIRSRLKEFANDSLFYFGIFLTLAFLLNVIPYFGGLAEEYNIGINEVIVSAIGFLNLFFIKTIKGLLSN